MSERWWLEHGIKLIHDIEGSLFLDHDAERREAFESVRSSSLDYWVSRNYLACHCVQYKGLPRSEPLGHLPEGARGPAGTA